ncbi:hypothetical protein BDV97DRAFT_86260 [Delphinella strobiligena]|nr:hypothetical protein BDV97DRAFT_86260 [Delphinella strobiligena]
MPASAPPASVEDVNDATGEVEPDSRKYANNGAKRSNQSSKKEKIIRQDVPSDSGVSGLSYSSHASGGSGPSSRKTRIVGDPGTSKRRPTVSGREEIKQESRRRSPEKPVRRSDSKARRHDPSQYTTASCKDPDCRGECQVIYQRKEAARPSPLDTGMNTSYFPFTLYNQSAYQQPSPSDSQPAISPYSQANMPYGIPVGSRPRAISSANRPTSYHGYNGPVPPKTMAGSYSGAQQAYQNSHQSYDPFVLGYVQPPVIGQPGFPIPFTMPGSPLRPTTRPGLPHAMTDGVNYSPRASAHPANDIPRYKSDQRQDFQGDDDYITTRPGRRGSLAPPYPEDDTSESSPERESNAHRRRDGRTDRDMMPPPSHRPSLRHSATTSDAVPRRSESSRPVVLRHEPVYDTPSDHYDTDRSTRAVIAGTSHHRRPSDSRRSEKSYKTHISDPVAYRRNADDLDYPSSRRMSANSLRRLEDQRVAAVQEYQDNMRGFTENDMTADWLVNQNRKALSSGRTPSAISSSSHRSQRSRHSISSRTSITGGMTIEYKGATVDVPEGHAVSLERSPESGRSRLVIEDGTYREKSYVGGSSVRSSAQVSSGSQSRRSRAESEASRGRKHSVRPESRRPSD